MARSERVGDWRRTVDVTYRIGGRIEVGDGNGRPHMRGTVIGVNSLNQPYVVFDPPAPQMPRYLWDEEVRLLEGE